MENKYKKERFTVKINPDSVIGEEILTQSCYVKNMYDQLSRLIEFIMEERALENKVNDSPKRPVKKHYFAPEVIIYNGAKTLNNKKMEQMVNLVLDILAREDVDLGEADYILKEARNHLAKMKELQPMP